MPKTWWPFGFCCIGILSRCTTLVLNILSSSIKNIGWYHISYYDNSQCLPGLDSDPSYAICTASDKCDELCFYFTFWIDIQRRIKSGHASITKRRPKVACPKPCGISLLETPESCTVRPVRWRHGFQNDVDTSHDRNIVVLTQVDADRRSMGKMGFLQSSLSELWLVALVVIGDNSGVWLDVSRTLVNVRSSEEYSVQLISYALWFP